MLHLEDENFLIVKLWMVDVVILNHKQIMALGRGGELTVKSGMSQSVIQDENEISWALVQDIAVHAATNPDKVV